MVQYDEKELEENWLHLDEDELLDDDEETPAETDEDGLLDDEETPPETYEDEDDENNE